MKYKIGKINYNNLEPYGIENMCEEKLNNQEYQEPNENTKEIIKVIVKNFLKKKTEIEVIKTLNGQEYNMVFKGQWKGYRYYLYLEYILENEEKIAYLFKNLWVRWYRIGLERIIDTGILEIEKVK